MTEKWMGTKFKGVRYREHPSRKHGLKKDRYLAIRYQKDGKRVEEGIGWTSERDPEDGHYWTEEKAALVLERLKGAARQGKKEAPTRISEKRELEKRRREEERAAQKQAEKEGITFRQFFKDTYLPSRKASRFRHDETHFNLWLDPVIGRKPVRDITQFDLERVKKRLLDAGRSPRTCEYVLATFRQIWNRARDKGLVVGDSPSRKVRAPKFDNRRQRFMTPDEAERLLSALQQRDETLYRMTLLSFRTGLRASEIFALTWGCIDAAHGMILVMDTKSGRNRVAFMTDDLKALFESMAPGDPESLVFLQNNGKPFKEIPAMWRELVDSLGYNTGVKDRRQRVCFHTCRHSFASWHAMGGTDMFILKELLGHQVFAMTARYSHLSPDTLRAATKNIEKAVETAKKEAGKNGQVVNMPQ